MRILPRGKEVETMGYGRVLDGKLLGARKNLRDSSKRQKRLKGKTKIKLQEGVSYTFKAKVWQAPGSSKLDAQSHVPAFNRKDGTAFPVGPEWDAYNKMNETRVFKYKELRDGWYDYSCTFTYNVTHTALIKMSLFQAGPVILSDVKLINNDTGITEDFTAKKNWIQADNVSF
jgi:hypothetical protein